MSQQNIQQKQQEEEIDLREVLEQYLKSWPWFIIGIVFFFALAFVYLQSTNPVYQTKATIIIKEEGAGGAPELAAFSELSLFKGLGNGPIHNEIGIFRSKRMMTEVVKELNLNVRFFRNEKLKDIEVYNNKPFSLQLLNFDEEKFLTLNRNEENSPYLIKVETDSTFILSNEVLDTEESFGFGKTISLPYADILLTPNFSALDELDETSREEPIEIRFATPDNVASYYREKVEVLLNDDNSGIVDFLLEDPVREKAQDILNQMIFRYNKEAIEDKNLVSRNTAKFIEERLQIITQELDSVETGKEQFKRANQLTDIEAESQVFIENVNDFRNRQLEVETQLELANTMLEYLQSEGKGELLPSNLGFNEEGVVQVIQTYNQLVLERDRILVGSTERNPVIINLNNQIRQIRQNVVQSLQNLRTSLRIARNDFSEQEARLEGKIAAVPSKEKQFRNIERQQNIKEALYLFLLQKREETSLSLAVTAPKAKIVDSAYSSPQPIAPNKNIILLAGLLLGIIVPFLILYLKQLLNNKIQNRADIEKQAQGIPLVGEIPRIGRSENELVEVNDRSVLAESFRILHTNLQYLLLNAGARPGGNFIFVTSTVKGEGKTFVSFNLAITLSNAEKKVLIVGADLRNPQLQRYEGDARQQQGVSDYLVNSELQIKDLIQTSKINERLDILSSGSIPPNPSELWRQERTATLFDELKMLYDYIIVDTAPSMLVTDTFLINKFADLTLYVTRAGYTEKKLLQFAVDSKNEGKLHDMAFVLNDVDVANFGYGNKYGYSYGENKKGFWDKIKSRT